MGASGERGAQKNESRWHVVAAETESMSAGVSIEEGGTRSLEDKTLRPRASQGGSHRRDLGDGSRLQPGQKVRRGVLTPRELERDLGRAEAKQTQPAGSTSRTFLQNIGSQLWRERRRGTEVRGKTLDIGYRTERHVDHANTLRRSGHEATIHDHALRALRDSRKPGSAQHQDARRRHKRCRQEHTVLNMQAHMTLSTKTRESRIQHLRRSLPDLDRNQGTTSPSIQTVQAAQNAQHPTAHAAAQVGDGDSRQGVGKGRWGLGIQ